MPTSSQTSILGGASVYEPRYQVGDLIRNGLGAVMEITAISRASHQDGFSSPKAIAEGFTCYRMRVLANGELNVTNTRHLHELIDSGYREWAYVGRASDAARNEEPKAPQAGAR